MSADINTWDVLVVNKNWLVLGTTTIKNAIKSLFSSPDGDLMAAKAFNIEYECLGENQYNFDNAIVINPVEIDEWLSLEIRPFDNFISTAKQKVRIPTVIMAQNCSKTHLRKAKLTSKSILERDNYTCQYSGKQLPRSRLNIDHVISKDEWKRRGLHGSPDTWFNMVACDKEINSAKSNKSNQEIGLVLIKEPKEPLPKPAASLIKEIKFKDWELFLNK